MLVTDWCLNTGQPLGVVGSGVFAKDHNGGNDFYSKIMERLDHNVRHEFLTSEYFEG